MKALLLLVITVFSFLNAIGQEVDLVRLGYDERQLTSPQIGMAASADGKYICFVYADRTIKVFDIREGKAVKRFTGPLGEIFDVHLISDRKLAIVGKQELFIIDWKNERTLASLPLKFEATKSSMSSNAEILAVGQMEGNTAIFDLKNNKLIREILYKKHHVSALAVHPNGKSIVIGVMAAMNALIPLKLYDIATGEERATSDLKDFFTMASYSRNGERLIAWGREGLQLFDGPTMGHIRKLGRDGVQSAARNMAYGALITDEKIMMLTDTRAFNVSRFSDGEKLFTTMREDSPRGLGKIGIGTHSVYPLIPSGEKVIVNATRNNINQIYDATTNAMIAYFYSDSNDDFVIVARDGRVQGTPEALGKVFWTSLKSDQKTSLERTYQKNFTPRLLAQLTGEASSDKVFEPDDALHGIPVVKLNKVNGKSSSDATALQTTQKLAKIEVNITNPNEVAHLKVFQNSKLVKTIQGSNATVYNFDVSLTNAFGEQNYFYVIAEGKSGFDSEKEKFIISYKGVSSDKPKLYLVTIGINEYRNPKYNLNYAEADANAVSNEINAKSASLFEDVVKYSVRNSDALKQNILSVMEEIKSKALEQDMLIWYFAGHGVMSEGVDRDKDFFIIPHDITQLYGRDDQLFEKAISATELKLLSQQINAQKQVFILDACQSAGALEALTSTQRGVAEEKAIAQLARSTGTFWITSTGADQFASEFEKLGHGLFTYTLLQGVNGKADSNGDKKLTIRELSTYIENTMPELSAELKGSAQFPSAYSFGNDFPLAVY